MLPPWAHSFSGATFLNSHHASPSLRSSSSSPLHPTCVPCVHQLKMLDGQDVTRSERIHAAQELPELMDELLDAIKEVRSRREGEGKVGGRWTDMRRDNQADGALACACAHVWLIYLLLPPFALVWLPSASRFALNRTHPRKSSTSARTRKMWICASWPSLWLSVVYRGKCLLCIKVRLVGSSLSLLPCNSHLACLLADVFCSFAFVSAHFRELDLEKLTAEETQK